MIHHYSTYLIGACYLMVGSLHARDTHSQSESQRVDLRPDTRLILSDTCCRCRWPNETTRKADRRLEVTESTATVVTAQIKSADGDGL